VETQFLFLCRPSCGIIPRTYARYYYGVLKDLSSKKIMLGVLDLGNPEIEAASVVAD
jgi:hypothetical protein